MRQIDYPVKPDNDGYVKKRGLPGLEVLLIKNVRAK